MAALWTLDRFVSAPNRMHSLSTCPQALDNGLRENVNYVCTHTVYIHRVFPVASQTGKLGVEARLDGNKSMTAVVTSVRDWSDNSPINAGDGSIRTSKTAGRWTNMPAPTFSSVSSRSTDTTCSLSFWLSVLVPVWVNQPTVTQRSMTRAHTRIQTSVEYWVCRLVGKQVHGQFRHSFITMYDM